MYDTDKSKICLSKQKRRKFNRYKEIIESLKDMDADHLMLEYIKVKSHYESERGRFFFVVLFLVPLYLAASALALNHALKYGFSIISVFFFASVFLFFVYTFTIDVKHLINLKKTLMIIEEVKIDSEE